MATTTNYGWDTPDDTDLVKDGAAAIRTLGSSVDTTTKALNPSTTEGDIEYRSATADTNTRLGIGTAGQVLTVNSGADAPEWATLNAGGMTLISTTTLSGVSTVISSIPSTYKNLKFVISGITNGTGVQQLYLAPNSDATVSYYATIDNANNSVQTQRFTNTWLRNNASYEKTGALNTFVLDIENYASASYWKAFAWKGGFIMVGTDTRSFNSAGMFKLTSAISSMQITSSNGYAFTAGQVLLYGVQ
jgi:hypothetical protein